MKTLIDCKKLVFAWLKPDAPENPEERSADDLDIIFDGLDLTLPPGMTSVLGPNGVGKTTLLLLLGGRLMPLEGSVDLQGTDTRTFMGAWQDEALVEQRNRLASFVYQNMEFETDESLAAILQVMARDLPEGHPRSPWLSRSIEALGLEDSLGKKIQEMSKGEVQRSVIAMALHYGSPVIFMDEPVFALEEAEKHRVFAFLRDYAQATGTSIIYTAHDFDLCKDYAEHSLLLWRSEGVLHHRFGPVSRVCAQEVIEQAYQAPMQTLYQKERLYRHMLQEGRRS